MNRKIVQLIAISPGVMMALCDDGTVWTCDLRHLSEGWEQMKLPPIPKE